MQNERDRNTIEINIIPRKTHTKKQYINTIKQINNQSEKLKNPRINKKNLTDIF